MLSHAAESSSSVSKGSTMVTGDGRPGEQPFELKRVEVQESVPEAERRQFSRDPGRPRAAGWREPRHAAACVHRRALPGAAASRWRCVLDRAAAVDNGRVAHGIVDDPRLGQRTLVSAGRGVEHQHGYSARSAFGGAAGRRTHATATRRANAGTRGARKPEPLLPVLVRMRTPRERRGSSAVGGCAANASSRVSAVDPGRRAASPPAGRWPRRSGGQAGARRS